MKFSGVAVYIYNKRKREKKCCSLIMIYWDVSIRSFLSVLFEIRKIAVCFLWLSLPGDCRVTDEALLAETT